jgi:hypothetical protein
MKPNLGTVLIYENFGAGLRARLFWRKIAQSARLNTQRRDVVYDVPRIREVRNAVFTFRPISPSSPAILILCLRT